MAQSILDEPILIIKDKSFIKMALDSIIPSAISGMIFALIAATAYFFILMLFSLANIGLIIAYVVLIGCFIFLVIPARSIKDGVLFLKSKYNRPNRGISWVLKACDYLLGLKKYYKLNKKELVILSLLTIILFTFSISPLYTYHLITDSVNTNDQNGYFKSITNTIENNQSDIIKINDITSWQKNNLLFTLDKSLPILYTNTYFVVNWPILLKDYPKSPYVDYFTNLPNIIIWPNISNLLPISNSNLSFYNNGYPKQALITIYSRDNNPDSSYEEQSKWILISKAGNCMEHSLAFTQLVNGCNIPVKTIYAKGEDHVFNAVFINNSWITVDPTQDQPFNPQISMEDYLKTNISYVYAIYPDDKIEDVTSNYTKVSNLTILVLNSNQEPMKDIDVKLYSNNKKADIYTNLSLKTDYNGICTFTIGQGSYNIEGNSSNSTGKLSNIMLIDGEDKKKNLLINSPLTLTSTNYGKYEIIFITASIITIIMVVLAYFVLILIKIYDAEKIKYFYSLMISTIAFLLIIDIAIEPIVLLIIAIVICTIGYLKYMKSLLNCSI